MKKNKLFWLSFCLILTIAISCTSKEDKKGRFLLKGNNELKEGNLKGAITYYDEALAIPSAEAATLALRTQQIIAHESGAALSLDPLGGSYMVEALTDDIEAQVMAEIEKIDAIGGAIAAIETGYFNMALTESAHQWHQSLENGEKKIVGQNIFETAETAAKPVFRVSPEAETSQRESLARMKSERDEEPLKKAFVELKSALERDDNLVPALVPLMRANATIGEVCRVLRDHYGEYQEIA